MGDHIVPKLKTITQLGRGGVCVRYHPRVLFSFSIISYPILSYPFFVTPKFA